MPGSIIFYHLADIEYMSSSDKSIFADNNKLVFKSCNSYNIPLAKIHHSISFPTGSPQSYAHTDISPLYSATRSSKLLCLKVFFKTMVSSFISICRVSETLILSFSKMAFGIRTPWLLQSVILRKIFINSPEKKVLAY